jgi:hypothetical protein
VSTQRWLIHIKGGLVHYLEFIFPVFTRESSVKMNNLHGFASPLHPRTFGTAGDLTRRKIAPALIRNRISMSKQK